MSSKFTCRTTSAGADLKCIIRRIRLRVRCYLDARFLPSSTERWIRIEVDTRTWFFELSNISRIHIHWTLSLNAKRRATWVLLSSTFTYLGKRKYSFCFSNNKCISATCKFCLQWLVVHGSRTEVSCWVIHSFLFNNVLGFLNIFIAILIRRTRNESLKFTN